MIKMNRQPSNMADDIAKRLKAVANWCNKFADAYEESLRIAAAKKKMAVGQKGYINKKITEESVEVEATGKFGTIMADPAKDLLPAADLSKPESSIGKYITEDGMPDVRS